MLRQFMKILFNCYNLTVTVFTVRFSIHLAVMPITGVNAWDVVSSFLTSVSVTQFPGGGGGCYFINYYCTTTSLGLRNPSSTRCHNCRSAPSVAYWDTAEFGGRVPKTKSNAWSWTTSVVMLPLSLKCSEWQIRKRFLPGTFDLSLFNCNMCINILSCMFAHTRVDYFI